MACLYCKNVLSRDWDGFNVKGVSDNNNDNITHRKMCPKDRTMLVTVST